MLKLLATYVIGSTLDNPIYGPFALVIALLVWISYFARLTMFGAVVGGHHAAGRRGGRDPDRPRGRAGAGRAPAGAAWPTGRLADHRPNRDRGALLAGAALGAAAVGLAVSLRKVADAADDVRPDGRVRPADALRASAAAAAPRRSRSRRIALAANRADPEAGDRTDQPGADQADRRHRAEPAVARRRRGR